MCEWFIDSGDVVTAVTESLTGQVTELVEAQTWLYDAELQLSCTSSTGRILLFTDATWLQAKSSSSTALFT